MSKTTGLTNGILLALGTALALGAIAMPVLNPDLYWHLSAGRFMTEHLRLPAADFLSWTEYGSPWTDFEWLSQLVFYAAHTLAGKAGFFILKMLLLGATLPVFYRLLSLYSLEDSAFFALPLWGLAICPNSDLRPENFSVFFFALLLWRLEKARLSGGAFSGGRRTYLWTAAIFALWANLHAGFVYGLLLLFFYAAGAYADRRLFHSGTGPGPERTFFKAGLAASAATLLNPWGYKIYAVLLAHLSDADLVRKYLAEWAPASLGNPWHWPYMVFLLLSFSLLLSRFFREKSFPAAHLPALSYFAFAAAGHERHIAFFSMAALAFSFEALANEPAWKKKMKPAGAAALAAALLYLSLAVWPVYSGLRHDLGEESAGAAAYLKAETPGLGGRRLYNPWNWGGYLGWALSPEYRVFVDGRYLFHKYLAPLSEAMADQQTWDRFASERGFGLVLFRRDNALAPFKYGGGAVLRPAYLVFMPEEKWALVYWDKAALLFARRPVRTGEFRLVRPGDAKYLKLELCDGRLKKKDAQRELDLYKRLPAPERPAEIAYLEKWLAAFPAVCKEPGY